ncbi:hypothetical protein [Pantoea sp. A4]|uniref:hypothetical protein n=1 Tax=Pantoea sp. A4 TaxID=1225184 RepID=UPI0003767675|nr:hypothetical protein [Pantoea sp. A4]
MANFKPFVGKDYFQSKYGVRVLVLGESHYGDDGDESEDYTQMVVANHAYTPGLPFFSRVTKLLRLSKDTPSNEERYDAWQQIAFYNFVQEFVGEKWRMSPTAKMWEDAAPMFLEVARELKPDIILVLGHNLWDKVPALPDAHPVEWCSVKHPAGGMSYDDSFRAFEQSLTNAKSLV